MPSVLGSTSLTSEMTFMTLMRRFLSCWFSGSAGFLMIPLAVSDMKFLKFLRVVLN